MWLARVRAANAERDFAPGGPGAMAAQAHFEEGAVLQLQDGVFLPADPLAAPPHSGPPYSREIYTYTSDQTQRFTDTDEEPEGWAAGGWGSDTA